MTDFTSVRKIRFGASARTSEGERGVAREAVVEPATGAAVAIGVRFGAFAPVVYATFDHLAAGTESEISLDIPRHAMAKTPPAGVRLTRATTVTLDGKRAGKLAHITFDQATRKPLRFVTDRDMVAPATALSGVDGAALALSSGKNGSEAVFGAYRPDAELREAVRAAIEKYARMRVDIAGVNIQAMDGAVWLRGHISSDLNQRLIEELASGVPGVVELHNDLLSDPDLAARISSALARDPATAEERIGVYPTLGRVFLRGAVRTADARTSATRIASDGFGAREIINELRVNPDARTLPVLAGVTGGEDDVPGGR